MAQRTFFQNALRSQLIRHLYILLIWHVVFGITFCFAYFSSGIFMMYRVLEPLLTIAGASPLVAELTSISFILAITAMPATLVSVHFHANNGGHRIGSSRYVISIVTAVLVFALVYYSIDYFDIPRRVKIHIWWKIFGPPDNLYSFGNIYGFRIFHFECAALCAVEVILWMLRKRGDVDQLVCAECGYSLRGLVEMRCPECGTIRASSTPEVSVQDFLRKK